MVGGRARKRGMRGFRDPMGDRPSPVGGRAFVVGGVRCVGSGGNQAPGAYPKRWALGRGMGAGGDTRVYICDQARYILLGCSVDGPAGVGGSPRIYIYISGCVGDDIYMYPYVSLPPNVFLQPIPVDGRLVVAGRHEYIYLAVQVFIDILHRLRPWVATGTPVGGRVRQLVDGSSPVGGKRLGASPRGKAPPGYLKPGDHSGDPWGVGWSGNHHPWRSSAFTDGETGSHQPSREKRRSPS